MAAIVPEFLSALRLKPKPQSTSNGEEVSRDFLSRLTAKRDGASSQLLTGEKDCDSSDKTASDVAVDDGFLALLNSALPLSNIRVMVS
jgi:hypothetical protein